VALSLADFVVMIVLVGIGCALSYVGLWLMLRERQQAAESQLGALAGALRALEARVAERSQQAATAAIEEAVAQPAADRNEEEVTPETLVMIAAAVTAYLGKKVRVRSAKLLLPPSQAANPWVQRGRTLVQCSHHPRLRH
jgi:Na+-transporting methylmalonyl-CoA/oxaloacetate decarboxylase beta subunit